MVEGPGAGLDAIDTIEGLDGYVHFHSARADMLTRLGREADAAGAYRNALDLATGEIERAFLERKLAEARSQ
jgi:RNA polymerase sigma-70 factor (ECF subfamily)